MNPDVLTFKNVNINKTFVDAALGFNVALLDSIDSTVLAQYSIALSQYLIFFRAEYNKTRVEILKKQRFIDAAVTQLLTKDVIKQYKTKIAAKTSLIANTPSLSEADQQLEELLCEQQLLDGIDKTITELIASFKRELTRRENEMYAIRKNR